MYYNIAVRLTECY